MRILLAAKRHSDIAAKRRSEIATKWRKVIAMGVSPWNIENTTRSPEGTKGTCAFGPSPLFVLPNRWASGLGAYALMLRSGPEWLRILAAHSRTWLESQRISSKPAARIATQILRKPRVAILGKANRTETLSSQARVC